MVSPFHARVKRIFYEAAQRPVVERPAFLADACQGHDRVRAEVESLLSFHREARVSPTGPGKTARRFRAGQVVGRRYRIAARVGRGGAGEVYRAWDLALEMPVALKVLVVSNPLARVELLREVRLAREVTHPAVCRVYDVGEADGETFITMEWIDGERLDALLEREARIAPERAVEFVRQLCSGVAAAHEKGIVHRDLKPGNVLIDRLARAHLMDFGTAVCLARPTLRDALPLGTPRYMAPEQLCEGGAITARTDVYALGLLLHELLTGIRSQPRRRPASSLLRARDIEPGIIRVVQTALAHDPERRYATAAEMGRALGCDEGGDAARIVWLPAPDYPARRPNATTSAFQARSESAVGSASSGVGSGHVCRLHAS